MPIVSSHNRVRVDQAVGVSLTVADLSRVSAFGQQWDHLVDTTRGIDRWCTRLPWQRSVDAAFGHRFTDEIEGNDERVAEDLDQQFDDDVVAIEEAWAYAFRVRSLNDGTKALLPLDSVWAFACPIVMNQTGEHWLNLPVMAADIAASLLADPNWRVAFLTGMESEGPMFRSLAYELSNTARVVEGESTVRCVASLEGGVDGFLSRRPRTFRRNLRQAQRHAGEAGVEFEVCDLQDADDTIERLQDVERRSWKGLEGSGIVAPDMAHLYALLVAELRSVKGLRVVFAKREGKDIGFILGGVLGGAYRGLQLSFVEEARPLSIGNLLQFHEITRLADACVERYDLGMDMPYKRLWSDTVMTTTPLIVIRP